MYRHLLERLISVCGRHEGWRIRVVNQYPELLEEVRRLQEEAGNQEEGTGEKPKKEIPVEGVYSPESMKGASHSVRAGLRRKADFSRLADHSCPTDHSGGKVFYEPVKADAYAFFVADQPWLSEETAEAFLSEMERRKAPLGSVCFDGQPGNPTWFSGEFLPELLELTGDKGGRAVLRRHENLIHWFEVKEKRELMDLDLPDQVI